MASQHGNPAIVLRSTTVTVKKPICHQTVIPITLWWQKGSPLARLFHTHRTPASDCRRRGNEANRSSAQPRPSPHVGAYERCETSALADPSQRPTARARLEQQIRDLTYNPTQLYSADAPWLTPSCSIRGAQSALSDWLGADCLPLDACRPTGLKQLWVLGGCADVPRAHAEKLLRPVAIMQLGERIGAAAAEEARSLSRPAEVKVAAPPRKGPVREAEAKAHSSLFTLPMTAR